MTGLPNRTEIIDRFSRLEAKENFERPTWPRQDAACLGSAVRPQFHHSGRSSSRYFCCNFFLKAHLFFFPKGTINSSLLVASAPAPSAIHNSSNINNGTIFSVAQSYTIITRTPTWKQVFIMEPSSANLSALNFDIDPLNPILFSTTASWILQLFSSNVSYSPNFRNYLFAVCNQGGRDLIASLLFTPTGLAPGVTLTSLALNTHFVQMRPGFLKKNGTSIPFVPTLIKNVYVFEGLSLFLISICDCGMTI